MYIIPNCMTPHEKKKVFRHCSLPLLKSFSETIFGPFLRIVLGCTNAGFCDEGFILRSPRSTFLYPFHSRFLYFCLRILHHFFKNHCIVAFFHIYSSCFAYFRKRSHVRILHSFFGWCTFCKRFVKIWNFTDLEIDERVRRSKLSERDAAEFTKYHGV